MSAVHRRICLWGPYRSSDDALLKRIKQQMLMDDAVYFEFEHFFEHILHSFVTDFASVIAKIQNPQKDAVDIYRNKQTFINQAWISFIFYSQAMQKTDILTFFAEYFGISRDFLQKFEKAFSQIRTAPLVEVFHKLGPWLSHTLRYQSFIFAIRGDVWDEKLHRLYFGSNHPLVMIIPFIPTLPHLQEQIETKPRFCDPLPKYIPSIYTDSYGPNLLQAIHSGIYNEIIFLNQNQSEPILTLQKLATTYVITQAHIDYFDDAFYVNALLQALLIPLKMPCKLLYDYTHQQWYADV